jgi:nitroreductase
MSEPRKADHPIESFFLKRWSPRSFVPEDMPEADLLSLFEAARWAPSSYNNQPWRFLYARRSSPLWPLFVSLLVPFNQSWARDASVLVAVLSNKLFDHHGKPSVTHSFDAGAAWGSLALQASLKGYAAHGMEGVDFDKVRAELGVPDEFAVECMVVIGKPGPKEKLPAELQEREAPSGRRPIRESIAEGKFAPHLVHLEKK